MANGGAGKSCPDGSPEKLRWGYSLCIPPSVYDPSDDTYMILSYLEKNVSLLENARVLDIGSGSGILSIFAVERGASHVMSVDISPKACETSQFNLRKILGERAESVEIIAGDIDGIIRRGTHFDLVLINPPYLPYDQSTGDYFLDMALYGGKKGSETSVRILKSLEGLLSGKYTVLLVSSSLGGAEEIMKTMRSLHFITEVVDKRDYFFERLYLLRGEKIG
ncbi:MAG: RsmD family RNA methyltransferase [Fervidicoccaceae archaeon]